tara:strand:+ start:30 stop:272 length:243 start_codon:yes stop_codon:yes gene_type:complete
MKTKAQELDIIEFPYREFDTNGYQTYYEEDDGFWWKVEYDDKGNETYTEFYNGRWRKTEYDDKGDETYQEWFNGDKEYKI